MTRTKVKLECLRKAIEVAPASEQNNDSLEGIRYYINSKNPKVIVDIAKEFYTWVTEE